MTTFKTDYTSQRRNTPQSHHHGLSIKLMVDLVFDEAYATATDHWEAFILPANCVVTSLRALGANLQGTATIDVGFADADDSTGDELMDGVNPATASTAIFDGSNKVEPKDYDRVVVVKLSANQAASASRKLHLVVEYIQA